jgi:hypothetical protein
MTNKINKNAESRRKYSSMAQKHPKHKEAHRAKPMNSIQTALQLSRHHDLGDAFGATTGTLTPKTILLSGASQELVLAPMKDRLRFA